MPNWIIWNRTVFVCWTELFEIEQFLHSTLGKQTTALMLNWNVWNRTVYMYKNGFRIK